MKEYILNKLKENKGEFVSGQEISEEKSMSRTAIWKAINKLKESGYEIESVTKKGYRLISEPDLLDHANNEFEKNWTIGSDYIYLDTVGSTNDYAKEIAAEKKDGTIVIAETQSTGKGRRGRNWTSQKGEGIWMTVLLKPDMVPAQAVLMTQVVAVAVAEGISDVIGEKAEIKWPNDIVLNKRKVCGILAELNGEIDYLNYIVIGMGINVNMDKEVFQGELADKATSIKIEKGKSISRKDILTSVVRRLNMYYEQFLKERDFGFIKDKSIELSATVGKRVKVIYSNETIEGDAIDLTDKGELLIKLDSGEIKEVISGEVSVRGLYSYVD